MPLTTDRVRRYFDRPERYLSNRFEIELRAEIVRELLGAPRGLRIVDVGCGDGSVSRQFLDDDCRLTMVDLSPQMLARCRDGIPPERRHEVAFHNADLLREAIEDRFDVVICLGVLSHVESVDCAIGRLAALCRPEGRCVLQFTDATRALTAITRGFAALRRVLPGGHGYITNRVTPAMVFDAARRHGLAPVATRRYSLVPPGARRLPGGWLARYQRWTLRTEWFSRMCSEVVVALRKCDLAGSSDSAAPGDGSMAADSCCGGRPCQS